MKLHWIFDRFMAPADDGTGGAAGGAAADRGDDFVSTDDAPGPAVTTAGDPADDTDLDPDNPDADTDAAAEPAATKPKGKDSRIPLARHEAVLAKERERRVGLEAENARLRQTQQAAAAGVEMDAAETALAAQEDTYEGLLADGKLAEAKALRVEMRRAERAISDQRTAANNELIQARAVETVRYDTTVERLELAYPAINPDHDDFDKELTGEVLDLKASFQASGLAPSAALQKAVKYVFPATQTGAQKTATDATVRVSSTAAQDAIDKAKGKAVTRNTDASARQPASTARVGMDHDKAGGTLSAKHVIGMHQDAFAKLDDATLAKMRGDEL
jgi:hypothetical protein